MTQIPCESDEIETDENSVEWVFNTENNIEIGYEYSSYMACFKSHFKGFTRNMMLCYYSTK